MPIKSYRDLRVWQSAMELVVDVYRLTGKFPKNEDYGLTSQVRRAAVSVPSNIAEGHARVSGKEFHRFLLIALGSLAELETQLMISEKLGYSSPENIQDLLTCSDVIGKQIRKLQQTLKMVSGC